ncbi:MAG TPA: kelch repeat-containing protein, partial [Gemmatimonadaceae bacterium]|nr:kelch repeat-containing protein [Gemmatimonadaceae bacterium]
MRSTAHIATAAVLLLGVACSSQSPRSGAVERTGAARLTARGTGAVRTGHVAALLGNGKLLLAGGAVGGTPTRSAELFDPATGTFTATGDLIIARVNASATVLQDGRILVVGGDDGDGNSLASAELYDPVRGLFAAAGSLAAGRTHHTATRLPSGHVLVVGGSAGSSVLATVEEYAPASGAAGAWTTRTALATARTRHTSTLLRNGRLLVAGGEDASGTPLTAELYDPTAGGSTTATAGAMTARARHVAVLLADG